MRSNKSNSFHRGQIHLSAHLINAVQSFGINQSVYVDYCPMVNDDQGAFWLSAEEGILNSVFWCFNVEVWRSKTGDRLSLVA